MMSIIKCYSVLVASGKGSRCNDLRKVLRDNLYTIDKSTNKFKIAIWKYSKNSEPDAHARIAKGVAIAIEPLFADIEEHFFSIDNPKATTEAS